MIWRTWYNEESGLLIKSISEAIKNEAKDQKRGFLSMLLVTLGASLLRNLLIAKDTIRAGEKQVRISDATSSFNKTCGKYSKFEKPKISYLLEKTLALFIFCSKSQIEDSKFFKDEESIDIF